VSRWGVIYLNGNELVRINMPGASIDYNSSAIDESETRKTFSLSGEGVTHLKNGKNIIAVEVHAADVQDPNLSFDLKAFTSGLLFIDKKATWFYYDLGQSPIDQVVSVEKQNSVSLRPAKFVLGKNYPNPFNPKTTIPYEIKKPSFVNIVIHNMMGQHITTLVNENKSSGNFTTIWDGLDKNKANVASGVYFYTLKINGQRLHSRKLLLIK